MFPSSLAAFPPSVCSSLLGSFLFLEDILLIPRHNLALKVASAQSYLASLTTMCAERSPELQRFHEDTGFLLAVVPLKVLTVCFLVSSLRKKLL